MNEKKVCIIGGGTVAHMRSHLALCAPAYGRTAQHLENLFLSNARNKMKVDKYLTKMAGGPLLETNDDIRNLINDVLVPDPLTKVVILSAALCDFNGEIDGV